jgi:alkylhydroperoxidase/carboxymuconolactone decarboxylase family protein YurZ
MPDEKPAGGARKTIGDIAPKLADITDDVLFGDIWERPQLSKRDRSLIGLALPVLALHVHDGVVVALVAAVIALRLAARRPIYVEPAAAPSGRA